MTNEPVAVSVNFTGEGLSAAATDETGPTPTPPQYQTGHLKQDPVSLAVAVRTNIPDPESSHDWGVMTVDRGGHYAGWDEVSGWIDK